MTQLDVLRLFREFVQQNATQWKAGANHHPPIWVLVAETLGEDNNKPTTNDEYKKYIRIGK